MNPAYHTTFASRLASLVRKETRQLLRDRSNLAIGLVLPLLLILLFGYGISLDVEHAAIAVVRDDPSPQADRVIANLRLTRYLRPQVVASMDDAQRAMDARTVDGILRFPPDFARRLAAGDASLQLVVHGADATTARIIQSYVAGALAQQSARAADELGRPPPADGVVLVPRLWFNVANTSTWYLVPGLVVLIVTLVGAFLTSLVVAREWERGTFEALFVTPVRPTEILIAKLVPYFGIGMVGFLMCLAAARWLFHVPVVGSLALLVIGSMLYLLVALGTGLLISSATKNQFLASQVALLTSFLPALMLSGFLFDLRNVPGVVRVVANLLPATHYLELARTLFLAGNVPSVVARDLALLTLYAVALLAAARRVTRKRIG